MNLAFSRRLALCMVVAAAPSGCGLFGGQTGEGDAAPPTCEDTTSTPVDGAETTALGFSTDDVLAWATQPMEFDLDDRSAGSSTTAVSRRAHLQLTSGGAARFIEADWGPDRPTDAPDCRGRLVIDVHVVLDLDADAAATTSPVHLEFDTALTTDTSELAHLSEDVNPEAFTEGFTFPLEDGERVQLFFINALLGKTSSAGSLSAVAVHRVVPPNTGEPSGDAPRARPYDAEREVVLGVWPSGSPCELGSMPVDVDDTFLGVRIGDALPTEPVSSKLTWTSGDETTVTLSASAQRPEACVSDVCVGSSCWRFDYYAQDGVFAAMPVTLDGSTEDGRWKQAGPATFDLVIRKDGSGFDRGELSVSKSYPSLDELEADTGLRPDLAGSKPPLQISLRASVIEDGRAAAPNGTLYVFGVAPVSCTEMCTGPPMAQLEAGTIGDGTP